MTAASKTIAGFNGSFSGHGDFAFTRKYRHKLLLSYLCQERLNPTYQAMLQQSDIYMCGSQLKRLVSRGQWVEALGYLGRFNSRRSLASNVLHFFLHTLWALTNVAAGARTGSVKSGAHCHGVALSTVICRCAKLCSLVKAVLASPAQRVALDSHPARVKAAMIAHRLALEDPDLERLMQLPIDGQMPLPDHLIPIIYTRPRRHLKRLPGRRAPGPAIAKLYLNKRRSLLHSSSPPNTNAFMDESLNQVAGLIDECIKAGKPQKQLQSVGRVPAFLLPLEPPPAAPFLQTNSRTTSVPNQAKNSGILSAQSSVLQLAEVEAMQVNT